MYLWLVPNEIRPNFGRTFTSMQSGIVEVQTSSLGGHSLKPAFVLWQVPINNFISFSQFSLNVIMMPRPTTMGTTHEVLALANEGMWKSAIAGRVGLTHATVNRFLWRHVATGYLVPDMSMGALRTTTSPQDRALLRMVWQDRFISALALAAWKRILYEMKAARKTINNWLWSRGYDAYRTTRKPHVDCRTPATPCSKHATTPTGDYHS